MSYLHSSLSQFLLCSSFLFSKELLIFNFLCVVYMFIRTLYVIFVCIHGVVTYLLITRDKIFVIIFLIIRQDRTWKIFSGNFFRLVRTLIFFCFYNFWRSAVTQKRVSHPHGLSLWMHAFNVWGYLTFFPLLCDIWHLYMCKLSVMY